MSKSSGTRNRAEAMVVLHFCVRDTGIGIAKEKQDMVFGAFTQADSSTTRKYGGTGLGLAITRRLVDLMGGKLWLESGPGVGSAFHFTIRFERASAQPAPDYPDPKILSHASILVVDDNETNRIILVEMLGRWGMQVATAKDAREALEILTRTGNRAPASPQSSPICKCRIWMASNSSKTFARVFSSDKFRCSCSVQVRSKVSTNAAENSAFQRIWPSRSSRRSFLTRF